MVCSIIAKPPPQNQRDGYQHDVPAEGVWQNIHQWEPLLGNHASQVKANVLKAGAQIRTLFLLGTLAVGRKFANTGSTGALGIVSNKACINVLADGLIMCVEKIKKSNIICV